MYVNTYAEFPTGTNSNSTLSSITTSSSSSNSSSEIPTNQLDNDSTTQILYQLINRIGAVEMYDKLLNDVDYFKMNSFQKVLKGMTQDVMRQKNLFIHDVKLHNEVSREPFYPYSEEKYMEYKWVNGFCMSKYDDHIVDIAQDFSRVSEKIAQVLILENTLPLYKKVLKPINIGGKAGGVKYIVSGILFKFAEDVEIMNGRWLYGKTQKDNILASKGLDNELKALRAMYQCRKELKLNIKIPLMCSVKYLGLTVCAVSILPIGTNTLCYGSGDAGATIYDGTGHPSLIEEIDKISNYFGLAEHPIEDQSGVVKNLSLAADVEIHCHNDDYFMLDFGRFLPPNDEQDPLMKFFRYEFLLRMRNKISADCFLGFGRINNEHYEKRIQISIQTLRNRIIRLGNSIHLTELASDEIKSILHADGVNLRYLGQIRRIKRESISTEIKQEILLRNSKTKKIKKSKKKHLDQITLVPVDNTENVLLMEIILRSIKILFQKKLYEEKQKNILPIEVDLRRACVNLNLRLLDTNDSIWHDCLPLKGLIMERFSTGLTNEEMDESYNLLNSLSKPNVDIILENIGLYSGFSGGHFTFDTELYTKTKTSIPHLVDDEIVNELITSKTNKEMNLEGLWERRDTVKLENRHYIQYLILCLESFHNMPDRIKYFIDLISFNVIRLFREKADVFLLIECLLSLTVYDQYKEEIDKFIKNEFYFDLPISYFSKLHMFNKSIPDQEMGNLVANSDQQLYLFGCDLITDASLSQLISHSKKCRHASVRVSYCPKLTSKSLEVISYLDELTYLDISSFTNLSDEGMEFISRIPTLRTLLLKSQHNQLTGESLKHLINLQSLEYLDLADSDINDDGLKYIATLTSLITLILYRTKITQLRLLSSLERLETLKLKCKGLSNNFYLKSLKVFSMRTGRCNEELAQSLSCGTLRKLSLKDMGLHGESVREILLQNPEITQLNLVSKKLEDHSMRDIFLLTGLTSLDFSTSRIGDSTVALLVDLRLERLNLSKTFVTNDGLIHLKNMHTLNSLNLNVTNISRTGLCNISGLYLEHLSIVGCKLLEPTDLEVLNKVRNLSS